MNERAALPLRLDHSKQLLFMSSSSCLSEALSVHRKCCPSQAFQCLSGADYQADSHKAEKTAQSCLLLLADIIDSILQALIISASRKAAMPHRGKKVPLSSQGHSRAVQSHHKALKPYMALQSQSFDISGMLW